MTNDPFDRISSNLRQSSELKHRLLAAFAIVITLSAAAYLSHLVLSLLFSSALVFSSLFVVGVGLLARVTTTVKWNLYRASDPDSIHRRRGGRG